MASPLRSAILRGFEEQEPAPQEKAEAPAPKPGLGALARAIGRGKEVKKVTIVGDGGGAGDPSKRTGPKHGDKHPYYPEDGMKTMVYDEVKKKYVTRASLGPSASRTTYEK